MTHILLISDLHLLTVKPHEQKKKIKPYVNTFLLPAVSRWRKHIYTTRDTMFAKVPKIYPNTFVLGDLYEPEFALRGITTKNDEAYATKTFSELKNKFQNLQVIPGNHDLGIHYHSTDVREGMSHKSVSLFQKIHGPLWYTQIIDSITFLMITSSLVIEDVSHDVKLQQLKDEQLTFIIQSIEKSSHPVVLVSHHPESILHIHDYLSPQDQQKIIHIFFGHIHTYHIWNVQKKIASKEHKKIYKSYKMTLIPSLFGFLGFQKQYGVFDTEKKRVTLYKI